MIARIGNVGGECHIISIGKTNEEAERNLINQMNRGMYVPPTFKISFSNALLNQAAEAMKKQTCLFHY